MRFPELSSAERLARLQPPKGRVRMVLDTDTYNEIDDQFAVVYALLSPEKVRVEAIYAAPFFNDRAADAGDGMEKSYAEILRLLQRLEVPAADLAFRGATGFLTSYEQPRDSTAVRDLMRRAQESVGPLYVVAIGALTNVASAILIEPSIIEKITVVWLGGHALHWPHTNEFNLQGDVLASRLVLDCGVPLVLLPCMGVTSHLRTTLPEIERYVLGRGAVGDYLAGIFKDYASDHFARSKEIWDLVAVAYLVNASWMPSSIVASPLIDSREGAVSGQPQLAWRFDDARHKIRCATYVDRDPIFRDLFSKLADWANGRIKITAHSSSAG